MSTSNPEPAASVQPAQRTLEGIFEAVENAGNLAAKMIVLSRHDEQMISLLHDLIGDLCVVRLGAHLLLQQDENGAPEAIESGNFGR